MTSRSTPYRRRVLGRGRGGFKVTNRSTSGADQRVAVPEVPNISTPQRPETRTSAVPIAQQGVMPLAPTFGNRYQSDAVSGYSDLLAQQEALQGGLATPFGYAGEGEGSSFSFGGVLDNIGITERSWSDLAGADAIKGAWSALTGDEGSDILHGRGTYEEQGRGDTSRGSGSSAGERDPGLRVTRPSENDISADDRLRERMMQEVARAESGLGPDEDSIQAALDTSIAQFEVEKALLEAKREGALADGLEGVADQFGDQILQQEKAIQKMKDEIALTSDIEGWYRRRIKEPYERAIQAAKEIDFQKTLAVASKYRDEQANSLAETEERLEGVLADIGFAPEQIESFRGERAADNEVTAAMSELLEASGVRKGELDWEKKLKQSMAEEEHMRSNRQSSGREMIVTEQNRRAIGEAEDRIGELNKLEQKAMDRVRRAVDREFEGAKFPSQDEFRGAAMDSMRQELYGDMPPAQQAVYDEVWQAFAATGRSFSRKALTEMLANREIEIPGVSDALSQEWQAINDEWEDAARIAEEAGQPIPAWPQAAWQATASAIVNEMIDSEDIGILQGMTNTWERATTEYARYQDERSTKNYSNAENANAENIADARAGQGVYGERVRVVNSMVPVIEGMWGVGSGGRVTDIQGQNYFRPSEDPAVERKKGRSPNSDHKTAGALDLFLDANDPKDVAYFRNVIEPQLRIWQDQGLIASYVPLGANAAHDNHTHVSFALGAMNDQGFNTATIGTGGGDDWMGNVDQGLRGPIGI